jgi:UDP-3-O-[3-hydroxymyristoyl] N-acetylglucosamine deacetylase
MDRYQSTIRRNVTISGIGLHTGRDVHVEICPAAANTGIVFLRVDNDQAKPVPVHPTSITNSELSTTIGSAESGISTIEHLMAAFAGLGIDNVLVKVDAPELPIMDGSAAPFVEKILNAGIAKQEFFRKLLVIKKPITVRDGDRWMRIEPSRRLSFKCHIDYGNDSVIGQQSLEFIFSRSGFLNLCESRTFCHIRDVEAMRSAGFALGGSLDNAVVVTDKDVMNEDGLRSVDEFVKHKILDCVGDMAILGSPIVGKVTLHKPGHALHAKLMCELTENLEEYVTIVEFGGTDRKPAVTDTIASVAAASAVQG